MASCGTYGIPPNPRPLMVDTPKTQADRFKEAARELETDDDPERFKERLRKLVKHKTVEKPE